MAGIDKNEHMDTQMLGQAITELNISRNNISIYPRNHPIVEQSLGKAFDRLEKCFEHTSTITLAVANNKLIVEEQALDTKNHVFKEFALCLSRMNIACVMLSEGLTKEELYSFHSYIISEIEDTSSEHCHQLWSNYELSHVKLEFINYSSFFLADDEAEDTDSEQSLWEEYIAGMLEGTLKTEDISTILEQIPPEKLSELLNAAVSDDWSDIQFSEAIKPYIEKYLQNSVTGKELNTLITVVTGLRPDLKKQFLQSTIKSLSEDMNTTEQSLRNMSSRDIINVLSVINEHMVTVPDALSNVLEEFSKLSSTSKDAPRYQNGLIEDDILISPEITSLLEEKNFSEFVSDEYQEEIRTLINTDTQKIRADLKKEYMQELSDEYIEGEFNKLILDLTLSNRIGIMQADEYDFFISILKKQLEQFIEIGQYKLVLNTLTAIETNAKEQTHTELSESALEHFRSKKFLLSLADSFRIMGRQMRDDVFNLCDYYGALIVPCLLDALIDEESQSIRSFLISLITHFGDKASPEVLKRLDDSRWFVKRNMLFILLECGSSESLSKVQKYCAHDNPKVSIQAVKCLLKANDKQGISELQRKMRSASKELVSKAIDLAGAFRLTEMVTDLSALFRKKKFKGSDLEDKIRIMRALGQIGSDQAMAILNEVLSAKSLFNKGALDKLKNEARKFLNRPSGRNTACKENFAVIKEHISEQGRPAE